jgi:hypothetical protein
MTKKNNFLCKFSGKGKQTLMLLGLADERQVKEIEKLYVDGLENGGLDIQLRIINFRLGQIEVDTTPPVICDIKTFNLSKLEEDKCVIPVIKFIKKEKKESD